jgi:hypothetical protein
LENYFRNKRGFKIMIFDIGCELCGNNTAQLKEQDCPEGWMLCSNCSIKYEEGEGEGEGEGEEKVLYTYDMENDSLI